MSESFPVIYGKLDEYPEGRCELVLEFWQDLKDDGRGYEFFNEPYLAYPFPIFRITTKEDYIFGDSFWDIFHQYPFHICHVLRLDSGEYDVRFKIASKAEKTDGD